MPANLAVSGILCDCELQGPILGSSRNRPDDDRGSFRFHGRTSSRLNSIWVRVASYGVSAAKMDFCTVGLERFPK